MVFRNIIERNIFINDLTRKIICNGYNKELQTFIDEISKIDSIKNYEEFKRFLENIPEQLFGSTYSIKRAYAENTLYGYADSVMNYGGLEKESLLFLPLLEHGIDLSETFYAPRYVKNRDYIFQGANKIKHWEMAMGRKAYSIGPFIHYAKDYYSKEEVEKFHKKNGKTLLIFPPHTDEYGGQDFFIDSFLNEMFRIAKDYDTIIASVFWIDVNDKYIDYLKSNGVCLVSSGFKLDNQFASRMKSIIKMSDAVLFPILTTSIGYAYYLNKKVICINCDRNKESVNIEDQEFITEENNRYVEKFCRVFTENAPSQSVEADALVDFYWGISNIRSKEQIRKIYYKSKRDIIGQLGF